MTGNTLSLFQYRFPPGATPHNASGMASLGASSIKIASPALFDGLTFKKRINEQKNTSFGQNQGLVWSSDPSLWGNQLLTNRTQVLDRTKALYGPRTRASGETNYLQTEHKFWTEPRPCNPSLWGNQLLTKKTTLRGS